MGTTTTVFQKFHNTDPPKRESDMFEITDDNGLVFCNDYYIPEEVLLMILSHLSPKDLVFICRRVCKYWCNVIDSQVWKLKLSKNNVPPHKTASLTWFASYWVVSKSTIGRNLVKNNCGQDKLKHWDILSDDGDGWLVEKPPVGCEGPPKECIGDVLEHTSCFATSFYTCAKRQLIDLRKEGAIIEFMDIVQPDIIVSEWFCGRFDCVAVYNITVRLLNEDQKVLHEFEDRKHVGSEHGCAWHKMTHVFRNYGRGVAYVEFIHGGMDSQFWKGHYGSKMTMASVILSV